MGIKGKHLNLSILILDDEKEKRSVLSKYLKNEGYDVYPAETIDEASRFVRAQDFDFAIIDLKIDYSSDYGGISVIETINKIRPKTKVIVLSAYENEKDSEVEKQLEKVTYYGYVSKGGQQNYITAVIDQLDKLKVIPPKKKCFVIMPFSSTNSCTKEQWSDIFENTIKAAVDHSGFDYECFRASLVIGNIIRDIFDNLYSADVVVADLTDKNANVFYELGVRHTLRNATILIAQNIEHIPFDLNTNATLIYDWKTKSGREEFSQKIKKALSIIEADPTHINVISPIQPYLKKHSGAKRRS